VNRHILVIVAAAVAIFAIGIVGALAFTGGDSDEPMMTMPDGSTMPSAQMSTTATHTMGDGSTMNGMEMHPAGP
jgi:hypothetical protein